MLSLLVMKGIFQNFPSLNCLLFCVKTIDPAILIHFLDEGELRWPTSHLYCTIGYLLARSSSVFDLYSLQHFSTMPYRLEKQKIFSERKRE